MDPIDDTPSSELGMAESYHAFSDLPASSQGTGIASTKLRKPPTITPKRFTRFFTPRQSGTGSRNSKYVTRASRQLRDITKNANNQKAESPKTVPMKAQGDDFENLTPRRSKRRKLTPVPESSPIQLLSSPSKHVGDFKPIDLYDDDAATVTDMDDLCDSFTRLPSPIKQLKSSQPSRILQRTFGGPSVLQRGRALDPCVNWRHSTADFYSGSDDSCSFDSSSLPFCVTACHSNSLVALGAEDGSVTMVDSSSDPTISFAKPHVSFRPHHNAIMDMSFSSDDFLIATASGDQTARVIDMRTQQTRYIMAGHVSSLKTVRFQPGNDSVLATSSRDGSVQLWDLRCRGSLVPPAELHLQRSSSTSRSFPTSSANRQVVYAETCISIRDAHSLSPSAALVRKSSADLFSSRPVSQRNDVSITALSFLPGDRSHLLVSASEANASIKVWDIRGKYNRRGPAIPLASTADPPSHVSRKYGMTSLTFSSDGGRLYASCRDSTVYAYSTNHLILGHAPELDSAANKGGKGKWRGYATEKQGLGPLYGFRHKDLKITSFYIKADVRKTGHGKEELLAVGSRDGNAVLFPTDEGYFKAKGRPQEDGEASLPGTPVKKTVQHGDLPIYELGTPLVRGHRKEVTSLSWTADGELVTVSDDFSVRCWREGSRARELRTGGEVEGRRWECGWAEVEQDFDAEDV
ncbi:hypothetical protein CAC42_2407 [Sphaceloma murrayae]|uniref:Cell division cycle protein cdt2 n=1 Tax=Sphaceloma murrayae TaxID=2082308 RepID=A0A2K1QW96_9PEZI|nr:hypothetical protein CAC42_2407 [Sphaceloma murrayae]